MMNLNVYVNGELVMSDLIITKDGEIKTLSKQQDKIALLEAKLNAKEQAKATVSDNNDKLVMPNRFCYSVKDMIAKSIAYEEAQKASKRIIECK